MNIEEIARRREPTQPARAFPSTKRELVILAGTLQASTGIVWNEANVIEYLLQFHEEAQRFVRQEPPRLI